MTDEKNAPDGHFNPYEHHRTKPMTDDAKAREVWKHLMEHPPTLKKSLSAADVFLHARDKTNYAEQTIATALREARQQGMRDAAEILWDNLPEYQRKFITKKRREEKALRLELRDAIERAADEQEGFVSPWQPTQDDMLAEDWEILP